jgi:hypothetical protein
LGDTGGETLSGECFNDSLPTVLKRFDTFFKFVILLLPLFLLVGM